MRVRISGDRLYPEDASRRVEALPVPTSAPGTSGTARVLESQAIATAHELEARSSTSFESVDGRRFTIHPIDHVKRLSAYEALAAVRGLPVRQVWRIVNAEHGAALRGATGVTQGTAQEGTATYTVWMNALKTGCALHRLHIFAHEAEHIRRAHSTDTLGPTAAKEEVCDAAADREVLAAATHAVMQIPPAHLPAGTGVTEVVEQCRRCASRCAEPCSQGAAIFEAVNAALAPL